MLVIVLWASADKALQQQTTVRQRLLDALRSSGAVHRGDERLLRHPHLLAVRIPLDPGRPAVLDARDRATGTTATSRNGKCGSC